MRRFRDERAEALFAGLVAPRHRPARRPRHRRRRPGLRARRARRAAGRSPRGGSQAISDALAAYLKDLGGTDPHRLRGQAPRRTAARARLRLRHLAHRAGPHRRAWAAPTTATATAPASSRSTTRWTAPCPWTAEEARRAGTVHVGPTAAEIGTALARRRPAGRAPDAALPDHRAAQPRRLRAGRPRASTSSGRTAMSRTAGRATPPTPSSANWSASPPGSATAYWPAPPRARPNWPPATPTTSAATSPAAPPTACSCCSAPSSPALPVQHRAPGRLPLLLGDAARPRRARHVGTPRGAGGLAAAAAAGVRKGPRTAALRPRRICSR